MNKEMNIDWIVFLDLVDLVRRGGMHERVYVLLKDIVEAEIERGVFPDVAKEYLEKIKRLDTTKFI